MGLVKEWKHEVVRTPRSVCSGAAPHRARPLRGRTWRLALPLLPAAMLLLLPLLALAQTAATGTAPNTLADDPIPLLPGTHRLAAYITVNGATLRIPYVLFIPETFTPREKPPVILFLHGAGERGTDLDAIFIHGVQHEIGRADRPDLGRNFPFIVISPQCPPRGQRWDDSTMPRYVDALLDRILSQVPHDADRISCTGLSMGGQGAWRAVFFNPDRYAAIVPISASAWHVEEAGEKLKKVHTLAFCGTNDRDRVSGSHAMAEAIHNAGGDARCIELPGGHMIWGPVYQDPRLYEWLLMQRRSHPGATTPPAFSNSMPLRPGFHQRCIPIELGGQSFTLDCAVYLPADYRAGSKYPALLFLADDLQMGTDKDGMILHGPAAGIARGDLKAPRDFVILCPQLLPAIAKWSDPTVLAALEKSLAAAEQTLPIDPQRLYVAGANLGARGATMLSHRSPGKYLGEVAVLTNPRTALSDLRGDWMKKQPVMIVATTPLDDGRVQQINAFLAGAASGSNYTVLPATAGVLPDPFASSNIYQWLLQAKPH